MEFRQLQLFVAVAEELHFGRAAIRVGMAQPPLSQQIRRLEAELGVSLLTRTSRRVALTAAGSQVLEGARELLSRRADLESNVRLAAQGETGVVRLGFSPSTAFGILPDIIRRFRAEFPGVTLQIDDRDVVDKGLAVAAGDLDLAIVRGPFRHPAAICESLLREPFMLALSASHPLARNARVALSALADQPFVLFSRASAPGLHDTITSMCLGAGFSPDIVQEAGSWSSVVSLIEAGLGITIAPGSARALCPNGVVFRALEGAMGEAELVLVEPRRPLSPAAKRFRTIARQAADRRDVT
ncbi:MAG: LysR family transcriptional regulator [Caulobacteraceae bacterium]|nr:LysR family transcriptional regulator [Caulobacteraceae bacterium]